MKYLVLLTLFPSVALAHAQLEQAVPAVGSTVATAPAELRLDFSEALEPRFCKVEVTDAAGAPFNAGKLRTDPANAEHLLVPIGKLPGGIYAVTWHAVSVDTHRTQGLYHFTVAVAAIAP